LVIPAANTLVAVVTSQDSNVGHMTEPAATLRYDVVDVFTDRPFAGNPLAVVHGADGLSTGQLQAIAREFNLSETAFPLPPSAAADYRVRIFTPASEIPFAGHPSIGTAWVLARDGAIGHGDVVQECGAGQLPLTVDADGALLTGGVPTTRGDLDPSPMLAAVGLEPSDLDGSAPAGMAGAGADFAFLAVARPGAVARARPDSSAIASLEVGQGFALFSFDAARRFAHVRMFAPAFGIPEDPATGSAALALGVFLVWRGLLPASGESAFTIDQGAEIGRPSRLNCTVTADGGQALRTTVHGTVAPVSSGHIAIPAPS
jgi:trans-2,3-dihydro-3-hydroxyanthranilate isomerase